jgi:hypothetical protein
MRKITINVQYLNDVMHYNFYACILIKIKILLQATY